jgi:hypothetical protein
MMADAELDIDVERGVEAGAELEAPLVNVEEGVPQAREEERAAEAEEVVEEGAECGGADAEAAARGPQARAIRKMWICMAGRVSRRDGGLSERKQIAGP